MVNGCYGMEAQQKVSIYEVTYSTKPSSKDVLSYSDIILIEAETHEELFTKVVDTLLRVLGNSGNYYVDSIGGDPHEPRPKGANRKEESQRL
jgi:hypothetical protein